MKKNIQFLTIILFFMLFIAYNADISYGRGCPFGGGSGSGGGVEYTGGGSGGSNVEYGGGTRGGEVEQTQTMLPANKGGGSAFDKINAANSAQSTKQSGNYGKIKDAAATVEPVPPGPGTISPLPIDDQQATIEPWLIKKDDKNKDAIKAAKEKVKKMQAAYKEAKKKVDAAKKALEDAAGAPGKDGIITCVCGATFATSPQGFDAMTAHEKSCEVKIQYDKKAQAAQKTFEATDKDVIDAENKFREAQKALANNNFSGTGNDPDNPLFEKLSKAFKEASDNLTAAIQKNKEAKKTLEDVKKYPETPEEKDKNKKIAELKKALEDAKKVMAEAKKNLDAAKKELAALQDNDPVIVIDDPIPFPVPTPAVPPAIQPFVNMFMQMFQAMIQNNMNNFFSFFFSSMSFQIGNQPVKTINTTHQLYDETNAQSDEAVKTSY